MAAAHFDPRLPTFDLSREFILSHATPPIQVANELTNSTTRSTYRLHWNWLALWDNFGMFVNQYWNNVVPQVDKQANVFSQGEYSGRFSSISTNSRVGNEGAVKEK